MKCLLFVLGLFGMATANAQTWSCGTDKVINQLRRQDSSILQKEAELEAFTQWFIANRGNFSRSADSSDVDTNYVVPVVFHILHDGFLKSGDVNNAPLDDKHIAQYEIQNMNEFWSATAPELGLNNPNIAYWRINHTYRSIVANMNIQFALARIDPNGNATDGIDRIYTFATRIGGNDVKRNPWPREKYLNIWVSYGLDGDTSTSGTLAFSMYPSAVANQTQDYQIDGIDAKASCVGVNPALAHSSNGANFSNYFARPCIAHEAGHWLNLKHPWGDNNDPGVACGDDEVEDTPVTKGQANNVASLPCDSSITDVTCDSVGSTNTNVQNIMNYANCHVMFTKDQRLRARAAAESTISDRINIWSPANLAATGVRPLYDVLPAPIAQFGYNQRYACIEQTVIFTDYTYNTSQWTREWTFPEDASTASSTDSMVNVTFSTPGWKTITLTATNASGSSVKTKTPIYIYDNTQVSFPYPYAESFDDSIFAAQWIGVSYDSDSDGNHTKFAWDGVDGHNSNGSFKLNGYYSTYRGDYDYLISPAFNLTGISTSDFRFSFDYSMACRFGYEFTYADQVTGLNPYDSIASVSVYITSGCNGIWQKVPSATIISNRKLFNGGFLNAPYIPGHDNQYWKTVTVDLSSMAGSSSFRTSGVHFMIAVTGARVGNNFYFDNFNLGNAEVEGISTIANIATLSLYPNPTADATTLLIEPVKGGIFTVEVFDMLGNKVMNVFEGNLSSEKEININTASLAQGVYTVNVSSNGKSQQQKLVKL